MQEDEFPGLIYNRVPDAFVATENWGLVTYKQSMLLFDEKTSGVEDQKRVAYGELIWRKLP